MSSSRELAEQFIKDQVKIMSQFGKAPKLSAKRYKEVITKTQRSFESLRPDRGTEQKESRAATNGKE